LQEFLKRIPSATGLSSQNADDKPTMFGSTSTNSLFGFGANEANMHKVASLDMIRRALCEQGQDPRHAEGLAQMQQGALAPPQPTQLFQTSPHQAALASDAQAAASNGAHGICLHLMRTQLDTAPKAA
jgi:hypothetical protein